MRGDASASTCSKHHAAPTWREHRKYWDVVIKPLSVANPASLTRREFTLGIGVSAMMSATPRPANALGGPDLLLILIADLHSGYAYTAALVKAVRDLVAANTTAQAAIVVNGDVFESGDVLCARNNGKIDLEVMRIFANLAPTIVNIGNHDGDILDPQVFATEVGRLGATLVTNITDPRTGAPYGFRALRSRSKAER